MTIYKKLFLNSLYLPFVSLLVYLDISTEQFAILATLLGIDYITGIVKTCRIDNGLKSHRAISGLFTKGSILFLVLALALMGKGLGIDISSYLNIFVGALIISETYSIFGNVNSAISGKHVEEFDAVSAVISKVREGIEKLFFNSNNRL